MEYQEVQITIAADGKVEFEVQGVKGMGCLDLTRALEEALGGQVENREMKPEAYETVQQQQQQYQWGG